jgi:hypothetical protein
MSWADPPTEYFYEMAVNAVKGLNFIRSMADSLRKADHSSLGVLPSVVCQSVIVKPR